MVKRVNKDTQLDIKHYNYCVIDNSWIHVYC